MRQMLCTTPLSSFLGPVMALLLGASSAQVLATPETAQVPPSLPAATATAASAAQAGDIPLRISHSVAPVYPAKARKEGMHGTVKVEVGISAEGLLTDIQILDTPGELLSDAVRAALRQTRYQAMVRNGEPVATRMRQEFRFYP